MRKGKFIVFEGIDGCGKTSHIEELYHKLVKDGKKVIILNNIADGSITGKAIRKVLGNKSECINDMRLALLFLSELHYVMYKENGIEEYLNKGYIVLCSRYFYSTYAYAGSSKAVRDTIKNAVTNLPIPDITFYLNVKIDVAIKRMTSRDGTPDYYENHKKLIVIKNRYDNLIDAGTVNNVLKVNNNDDFEHTSNAMFSIIKKLGE